MTDLRRADYRDLRRYDGALAPCPIDLSDNTNLWGTPPSVTRLLGQAAARGVSSYPDAYSESLKAAIAAYAGVNASQIATGAGSDDILDCAFRALAVAGARVAHIAPTFVMAPTFARTNGLETIAVPLTESYDANVDALLATNAQIIYLCSPNNPTGGLLSRTAVESILERAPGFVIVDEAYMEFAGTTVVDLVAKYDRLLITRTFSKAFGLAGLRVGYGIGSPEIVAELEKARGPYKVNGLGAYAVRVALDSDLDWIRTHVALAVAGREELRNALATRGIDSIASSANFLFAPFKDASAIAKAMRERGVAVRAFSNLLPVSPALRASNGSALRITVGPRDVIATALNVLDQALDEVRGQVSEVLA